MENRPLGTPPVAGWSFLPFFAGTRPFNLFILATSLLLLIYHNLILIPSGGKQPVERAGVQPANGTAQDTWESSLSTSESFG